jgi:asparagine synthase (glutamine-hydrolysing)
MCGITGYFGRLADPGLTRRMTQAMRHRGPDDEGFHHAARAALGMRRLSIIDRSGGAQPIASEDGRVVVVFNGEIYNHLDLRRELEARGHRFSTRADTEVLVHGYEEWGPEGLLTRLNGMFAVAVWDDARDRLFLARDRLGIKPLYYTEASGAFYFASEVKCFQPVEGISFEPDPEALPEYLALRYVPAPRTLFRGIRKLPAGHCMFVDASGSEVRQYWSLVPSASGLSPEEWEEGFGELFLDAVRIRLMSEVPLGAYLSAGLDSNLVVWAMSRELDRPVSTYSIGFGGRHDETAGARASAKLLGTDHHEIMFQEQDLGDLPRVIWHLDEPIGDAHVLPTFILAREARRTLTVILLGEGADESLYGYPFYKLAWMARRAARLLPPGTLSSLGPAMLKLLPGRGLDMVFPMPTSLGSDGKEHLAHFLRAAPGADGETVLRILSGLWHGPELDRLLLRPATPLSFPTSYRVPAAGTSPDALLEQINAAQFCGWLQDNILLRHDKLSMAHGAECRVPFLDHRLVEFLAGAPRRLKISGWQDKILSRRFASRHLPREVHARPKTPFFIPIEDFCRSRFFREMVRENLSPERVRRRGHFHPQAVQDLVRRATADNFLAVKRVTSLIILELWHRIFIDREITF